MPIGSKKDDGKTELAKLCKLLDDAIDARAAYRQSHRKIFEQADDMEDKVSTAQARIKALCHEIYLKRKRGEHEVFAGRNVLITATAKRGRVLDEARFLADHEAELRELGVVVDEHVVPIGIDKTALDKAVYKKLMERSIYEKYVIEGDPQTPSVSFEKPIPKEN